MGRGVFTGFYELCAFNKVTMVTNQGTFMQIYTFFILFSDNFYIFFWKGLILFL